MFKPGASLTVQNATETLGAGLQAIADGQREFDLADVTSVDSASVAVLLAWHRQANESKTQLLFKNLPANLKNLADMYGVADLLQPMPVSGPATAPGADLHHH